MDPTNLLLLLAKCVNLFAMIIFARCILSWLPIDWYKQPFRFLQSITDPVMLPFRNIIPSIGGLDLSPVLLFFGLQMLEKFLLQAASTGGF